MANYMILNVIIIRIIRAISTEQINEINVFNQSCVCLPGAMRRKKRSKGSSNRRSSSSGVLKGSSGS